MATNNIQEDFEKLRDQVHQLTDLLRKQAEYMQALAAFATPKPAVDPDRELTRAEATEQLLIGRTKFNDLCKELHITPGKRAGKNVYRQSQIERIKRHLDKQNE